MNPTKTYNSAKRRHKTRGVLWYRIASDFAESLSNKYGIDYLKVCGVISALSPACEWEQNKKQAEALCFAYVHGLDYTQISFTTYGHGVNKAYMILNEKQLPVESFFNEKTGAKTHAFFLNIAYPEHKTKVTIDRHIARMFHVERLTPKRYRDIAAKIELAAKKVGILPHEMQGVLWCHEKEFRTV